MDYSLARKDIENLETESAISKDVAKKYISRNNSSETLINGQGFNFIYLNEEGKKIGDRIRFFNPIIKSDGSIQKYGSLKGNSCKAYFVKEHVEKIFNSDTTLYCIEGEKKLLSLLSTKKFNEYPMIAYPGVHNWTIKNSGGKLAPIWEKIPVKGRRLIFLPDADILTNFDVWGGVIGLAKQMAQKGALIEIYNLGEKV